MESKMIFWAVAQSVYPEWIGGREPEYRGVVYSDAETGCLTKGNLLKDTIEKKMKSGM